MQPCPGSNELAELPKRNFICSNLNQALCSNECRFNEKENQTLYMKDVDSTQDDTYCYEYYLPLKKKMFTFIYSIGRGSQEIIRLTFQHQVYATGLNCH